MIDLISLPHLAQTWMRLVPDAPVELAHEALLMWLCQRMTKARGFRALTVN